MTFKITKNDIDEVYGKPYTSAFKITKSDVDKVYGERQIQTVPAATVKQNTAPFKITKHTRVANNNSMSTDVLRL